MDIKNLIYVIRGQQVMLDSDLAELYGYDVKAMNQQVKRNIQRFPEDFMFQLTQEEVSESLRSQIVTLNESGNKTGRTQEIPALCFYRARDLHASHGVRKFALTDIGRKDLKTVEKKAKHYNTDYIALMANRPLSDKACKYADKKGILIWNEYY